jgi:type II restriction enzyme
VKLGFEESQAVYDSGSQNARALTEHWLHATAFCPSCGHSPVADFACPECGEQFELKSQKMSFGAKILDGAYRTMIERLNALDNPNLLLMNYTREFGVSNLIVVPKQFFIPEIIEERKPLAAHARRAGWIGCNILFRKIPENGKIFIVRDRVPQSSERVREQWRKTLFLRKETTNARGWLLTVMKCVESLGKPEFTLDEVYASEEYIRGIYPGNNYIREKIRQQLQVLRDAGFLHFVGRGNYRLRA